MNADMKFTIDKSVLYKAINNVQRAADRRSFLAPLQGILLETNGKSLTLTATDLSLVIQCIVEDVSIDEIGSALIQAKFFNDLIRKLSGTITIETFEDKLKLDCGDLTATINAMDPEEFPESPEISDAKELQLPTKVLKTALSKTLFSTSSNDNRPVFTGVLFKVSEGNIDFVTTDTFRLTKFNYPIEDAPEITAIVPSRAMKELIKVFDGEVVKMFFNDKFAEFECGDTRITAKLIEGLYPNYEAIIPSNPKATFSVCKSILKNSVERADVFSDKDHRIIKMSGKSNLAISGSSSLFGEIKEIIKVEHEGNEVKIAFNSEYLLQAINVITGDKISINYWESPQPITMIEENSIHLLLSVRV